MTGYHGNDCSLSDEIYRSNVATRQTLCSSLRQTVGMQDSSTELITSNVQTVSSINIDPTQMNSQALTDFCL
jgi:hypothetical protein